MQCLVDMLPEDLAAEQRQPAVDFIVLQRDQFSKSEYDLSRTRLVQHQIDTDNNHPMTYLPVIDDHVQRMHDPGVIVPATSPWAFNVTIVRKEDGSLRFGVDYRPLNAMTGKDSYPFTKDRGLLPLTGAGPVRQHPRFEGWLLADRHVGVGLR